MLQSNNFPGVQKRLSGWVVKLDKEVIPNIKNNEKVEQENKKKKDEPKEEPQPVRRSTRFLKTNKDNPPVPVESDDSEPDIKSLSSIVFKGKIKYAEEFYECAEICDGILKEIESRTSEIVPIGFDLEWPFSFQTGSGKTALAQICLSLDTCYLLHIYNLPKLPKGLIEILSHPKVKLVGVNIKNDVWKLSRDFKEFQAQEVVSKNCLDCGPYANTVISRSCRWSLERLTGYLLKKRISKDPKVRNSRWHILPLSREQKLYAATDAYVSLLLYLTIKEKEDALDKVLTELPQN